MRAAEQAHPSNFREATPALLLARIAMAVLATLILLFVWRPSVLHAQAVPPKSDSAVKASATKIAKPAPTKKHAVRATAPKDTSATTHVVKAGETLWSIATKYYGDGHSWRALASRNGIPTSGEFSLKSGTRLQVPSRRAVEAVSAVKEALPVVADTTTPKVATTPAVVASKPASLAVTPRRGGALAAQTADKGDAAAKAKAGKTAAAEKKATGVSTVVTAPKASAVASDTASLVARTTLRPQIKAERMLMREPAHIGITDAAARRAARAPKDIPTVFLRRAPDAEEATEAARAAMKRHEPAPRQGEYISAPYPIESARLLKAGQIVRRIDGAGPSLHESARLQLADEVEITAPAGTTLSVGDRLIAVHAGTVLSPGVQIGTATGVLQVTRVDAGKAIHAYVRHQSGVIEQGQRLLPLEGAAGAVQRAEAVKGPDIETTITWVDSTQLMPTLQSYVLLAAGDAQGIKAGDEFALVHKSAAGPEERIGVVRVVRTGARGSSAVVIRQASADIGVGVSARRIARMP